MWRKRTKNLQNNRFQKAKHRKLVAKPHEKRSAGRSQLQAISQLVAGVNKLAEIDFKRFKVEERNPQYLLELRKEDAENNRKSEKGIG